MPRYFIAAIITPLLNAIFRLFPPSMIFRCHTPDTPFHYFDIFISRAAIFDIIALIYFIHLPPLSLPYYPRRPQIFRRHFTILFHYAIIDIIDDA